MTDTQQMNRPNFLARHLGKLWLLQAVVLIGVGFAAAWNLKGSSNATATGDSSADHEHRADEPKLWTCSMHPQIRRDKPGKCPICAMELVAVTSSSGGMRTVVISPAARELMKIETTPVERRYVTAEVRMVGKVEYDETRLSHITAWVSGRLDRLYVDFPGIEVKKGDHLVYIYSEELYSTQEELIRAVKRRQERPASRSSLIEPIDYVASAREKLRLLGLTADQIAEIEKRGTPADHLTIYSPIGGIVIEKLKQEGDRVRTGDRIYTVADLTHLWVKLDAYESDLQWLRYGQHVEFTTEAYPGERFTGQIAFIDPVLNEATRTVKVRVNVSNEDGRLKPEMFVRAVVHSHVAAGGRVLDASLAGKWISPMHPEIVKDEPGNCDICGMPLVRAESLGYVTSEPNSGAKPLVIPASAALITGKRAIVYVEQPTAQEPTFEGREIVLGPRAGDYYLVRRGLKEGDLVVTNGNFKLDSALQISAKPSMMTPEGGGGGGGHDHGGHGGETKSKESAGETGQHQMVLASAVTEQLADVLVAHELIAKTIQEADLKAIRSAFDELAAAVNKVDAKLLVGHAKMLWDEYSMLLLNDAAVGSEIATLHDADEVYLTLKRHIVRVRNDFGLAHDDHQTHLAQVDVPRAFQSQLAKLWAVYQSLGSALSSDDVPAAVMAAKELPGVLNSIDASVLEGNAADSWQREWSNLQKIVEELVQAEGVDAIRSSFALLSEEMLALATTFGLGDAGPVFELHCPMAFKGRGASWLQSDDQPRNPYYGKTMLKCADRIRPIPSMNALPKSEAASHDHQHP